MQTIFKEYGRAVIAILVALVFLYMLNYLLNDSGIIHTFNTYENTPDTFSVQEEGTEKVPRLEIDASSGLVTNSEGNIYFLQKQENIGGTWQANANAGSFSIPSGESYPFYYVSLNELLSYIKVSNGVTGGEWTVNVTMYKPQLSSTGSVIMKDVQALDSFGTPITDSVGNPVMKKSVDYIEYYVGDLKQCSLSDVQVSSLYSDRFGYDSIGLYGSVTSVGLNSFEPSEGTKGILVYNDFYPVKFKVTYRYTKGTLKAEYTALFSNKVDNLSANEDAYNVEYDRIFGGS